jgi:cytochrome c5
MEMSEQSTMTKANWQEVAINFAMGFLPVIIAIILIVKLVVSIHESHINVPANEAQVLERIKPVGEVAVLGANAPKVERSGEQVFNAVCTSCHTSGALNAPRFGNRSDWAPRIAKGFDALVKNAIHGINAMPPRGGSTDFSDAEIAGAVAYMANSAGAKIKVTASSFPSEPAAAAKETGPAAAPAPTSASAPDGKAIYEATCSACHGTGVAGAPKFGDKAAWAPRIKKGMDSLVDSALKGKNAMPPKGGNTSLSDADIKAVVEYMAGHSK